MAKARAPLAYLEEEFSRYRPYLEHQPELRRSIEDGLRSSEGPRWVEVAEALKFCTRGWAPFLLERASREPQALSWIVAAADHEWRMSGANHAGWLRSKFKAIPEIGDRLARLEQDPDPWLRKMAGWAQRVLAGEERWIGGLA